MKSHGEVPDIYIVRIYRREGDGHPDVMGLVEDAATQKSLSFHSEGELSDIFHGILGRGISPKGGDCQG
jgi:hypothetical protein